MNIPKVYRRAAMQVVVMVVICSSLCLIKTTGFAQLVLVDEYISASDFGRNLVDEGGEGYYSSVDPTTYRITVRRGDGTSEVVFNAEPLRPTARPTEIVRLFRRESLNGAVDYLVHSVLPDGLALSSIYRGAT